MIPATFAESVDTAVCRGDDALDDGLRRNITRDGRDAVAKSAVFSSSRRGY